MLAGFFEAVIAAIYRFINRSRVWYRLPFPLAVINLLALRVDLRWRNLFDTETAPLDPPVPGSFDIRHFRTADGAFNDLSKLGWEWRIHGLDATRRCRRPLANNHQAFMSPIHASLVVSCWRAPTSSQQLRSICFWPPSCNSWSTIGSAMASTIRKALRYDFPSPRMMIGLNRR